MTAVEPHPAFDRRRLLALLRRPFPVEEREPFMSRVAALEASLAALSPAPDAGPRLTRARLVGSQTLRGAPASTSEERLELEAWIGANDAMAALVRDDVRVTFDQIRRLNGLLCRREGPAALRTTPKSVGMYACPLPGDIDALLEPMLEVVDERTREVHPIAGAALLEQWLVTVHPFDDGNGRTSRLACDWVLAMHGYPPASYPTLRASVKALIDHGGEPFSVAGTCAILLGGLEHTVSLVRGD